MAVVDRYVSVTGGAPGWSSNTPDKPGHPQCSTAAVWHAP